MIIKLFENFHTNNLSCNSSYTHFYTAYIITLHLKRNCLNFQIKKTTPHYIIFIFAFLN